MNWNQVYQHKNKELVQILASFAGLTERLPLRISMSNTRSGEPGDTVQFYPEGCSNVLFSIQFYPDLLHFKWFKKTLERYGQEAALREILLNQIAPALSGSRMPHDTATEMRVELRPKDKPLTQQIIQAVFPVIREVCEQAGSSSRKSKPVPRVELSEEGAKDRRGEGVSDSSDSIGDQPTLGGQTAGPYALFPGQSLGQYKIIRPLGRGGMGEVYEVEHQVLRRRYALKLLPVDFMKGSNALQRFQREAQVMANLEHPNIIKVDDFGETDGRYWLRMELAEGLPEEGDHSTTKHTKGTKGEGDRIVTLADLAKAYDGKIPQETLLPILWQVLQALDYAHGHGAVHRDLKPSNILLATKNTKKHEKGSSEFAEVKNCTAKISDFGLVKLVGEEWLQSMVQLSVQRSMSIGEERTEGGEGGSEGSSTRSMLGTYEYMSPEQKRGEEADARSDLYSVGLMAYRLLTGRANVLKLPSRVDAALSSGWDDFVEQALEELPEERLQSAKEGLKLLDRVEQDLDGGLEKEQQVTVPPLPVRGQGTEVGGQEEKLTPVRDSARETRENNAKEKHSVDPAIRPKKKSGWKWVVGLIIAIAGFGWIGSLMDSSSQPAPSQPARQPAPQTRTEPARQASAPAATRTPESARQQNNPTAGNVLGMAFVEVKAGSFQMGSNNGDSYEKPVHQDPFEAAYDAVVNNGDSDEKPEHRVTLTQPFWMAKTEVTQAQYKKVMGSNPSKFKGAQNPVEQVSWNDAMNFCKKLTEIERKAGRLPEGFEYALPTEAQWEYACQAGTTGDYAGNLDAMAWYSSNSESKTHPVGTKQPNAWGLYDMHGNVWEWCSDWYGDYASGSVTDPPGASSGSYRVRRGGSWFDFASLCRSAHRYGSDPTHTFYGLGFRVVVAAPLLKTRLEPARPVPAAGQDIAIDLGDGVQMEFVWIPALKMWVGKYEVTNGEYRRKEPGHNSGDYDGHSLNHDRQPVVQVNFDDAQAYAKWLTERDRAAGHIPDGYEYRLPTKDEWTAFAQCDDKREYPWGNNWPPRSGQAGNYSGQESTLSSKISGYRDDFPVTCKVEQSWANPWGLHGVGGNVYEVTTKTPGRAFDAWRGAAWDDSSQDSLRCSYRGDVFDVVYCHTDGFRLVLSRPGQK